MFAELSLVLTPLIYGRYYGDRECLHLYICNHYDVSFFEDAQYLCYFAKVPWKISKLVFCPNH